MSRDRCGVDHDHPLSLVEDLGDGREVLECTNGCGEFILETRTGCLDPIGEDPFEHFHLRSVD